MARPVIHQVLIGASPGDAITKMALTLRDALREHAESDVYALWRHGPEMEQECRYLHDMPPSSEVDLLMYHSSIGWPEVSDFLAARTEPMAISYHNITPTRFYADTNPEFAETLELGRRELQTFRDRVVVAIADSEFNAHDLRAMGYPHVSVLPAGMSPHRLNGELDDAELLAYLGRIYPNGYVIFVGQVLPHKRIEQLLETMHLYNTTHWAGVGLVVCGIARQEDYRVAVQRFRQRCPMVDVFFTGQVSDRQLATYMRGARAFLGMSDHEGLCIPPLESVALGVPVVIKASGAVAETMGDAALLLPEDAGPELAAEAVQEILTNQSLRGSLILAGLRRAREVERRNPSGETVRLLLEAVR